MAKVIDFFDGAESFASPIVSSIELANLVKYANDAAFEADNQGAPQAGNIYYNTTIDGIRWYDAGLNIWKTFVDPVPSAGNFKPEYRTITAPEASAKQLTLVETPTLANEVVLDVIGVGPQFYADDFTVTGDILSWNGLGLDTILTVGDRVRITYVY